MQGMLQLTLERERHQDARMRSLPPLLDLVMNGGPSLTFNLIDLCQRASGQRKVLFRTPGLNRTIIFKYPNLDVQALDGRISLYAAGRGSSQPNRPMETGIFVPYDSGNLRQGGEAIYLRHPRYRDMLDKQFGLTPSIANPDAAYDYEMLNQIDRLPSLDPFLMKTELVALDPFIDQSLFKIEEEDMAMIKERIHTRFRTIIRKAFPQGAATREMEARFLDALWDPELPDGEKFISVFGIEKERSFDTFEALKGVTYYEIALSLTKPTVERLLKWVTSKGARPNDWDRHKAYQQQYDMFRQSIRARLYSGISRVREIFDIYHNSYRLLVGSDQPQPFCEFLRNAPRLYWQLGYFTAAFSHASTLHIDMIERGPPAAHTFDRLSDYLRRLDAIFSRAVAAGGGQVN